MFVDTIIVGAGIAGIAAGARLLRAGRDDIVILERAADVGGTWRDNVYPGVACDIPSHLYAFSFRPNPAWSQRYSAGSEIQDYLRQVARDEKLPIRFGTEVTDMKWDDSENGWKIRTNTGAYRCRTLILAAGRLSEPKSPEFPTLSTFEGPVMHSSRWDTGVDLAGKRVGVVGTGASAVQLAPRVAATAASTTLFQRSAAYVVPRNDAEIAPETQALFETDATALTRHREALFAEAELGHAARVTDGVDREALRKTALGHLEAQVPDEALRAALTPDYEIGCKRVLLSDDYYPAIASGAVHLEPSALVALDGNVAIAASGNRFELDAIVFATGFATTRPPYAQQVRGRDGRLLADHWSEGMTAYATMLVAGFPNLFVLDGPNAALGHNSAFVMLEAQAELAATIIARMSIEAVDVVEATESAEREWTERVDAAATGSVWLSGCRSWYVDERSGRLTLLWPGTATEFRDALRAVAEAPLPTRSEHIPA